MSLKIIEDLADKAGELMDIAYENNYIHYLIAAIVLLALIILLFGKNIAFQ